MARFSCDAILQAFRTHRDTTMYLLNDVTLTGNTLGNGSYGSVEEVSVKIVQIKTFPLYCLCR